MRTILTSADIGIIGGADGPTAVFVARNAFPWLVAMILLCLAVYLLLRRKVRRKKRFASNRRKS